MYPAPFHLDNMAIYFGRFAPELLKTDYGKEILGLYESGNLQHDTREQEAERRQRVLAAREDN